MASQANPAIDLYLSTDIAHQQLLQGLEEWLQLGLETATSVKLRFVAQTGSTGQQRPDLEIKTTASISLEKLIVGLKAWQELQLFTGAKLSLELAVNPAHPQLLQGLDIWARLALLDDAELKLIGKEWLVCPTERVMVPQPVRSQSPRPVRSTPQTPPVFQQMTQSLLAELSVIWLLLLGIFMVVISSAVLAASQWERFPASGQYGVLFLYTLVFGGASFWAGRQPNLQLTAQALRGVTLLLVPVNFLAIDSFKLWQTPFDWAVVAIASLTLTAITTLLFRFHARTAANFERQRSRLLLLNFLGLSYLHWGWSVPGLALLELYLGLLLTTGLTFYTLPLESTDTQAVAESPTRRLIPFRLNQALVVYGIIILLFRAVFISDLGLTQLGLAIGLCGTLLSWLSRNLPRQPLLSLTPWERIGGGLLGLGWLVAAFSVPWQALLVSGLVLEWVAYRLHLTQRPKHLLFLFLIGLQMHGWLWESLPNSVQGAIVAFLQRFTQPQEIPTAISLFLFPYLVGIIWGVQCLHRQQKWALAHFGNQIAWGFGVLLTAFSLLDPVLRTLNFALSTLTLSVVTHQHSRGVAAERPPLNSYPVLFYLTHLGGLLTFLSGVYLVFPQLSLVGWAGLGLGLMLLEWGLSLQRRLPSIWKESGWNFGVILGSLSYLLLVYNQFVFPLSTPLLPSFLLSSPLWSGLWVLAPIALTFVASQKLNLERPAPVWFSIVALGLLQTLTLPQPDLRLPGLGVTALLMLINTQFLPALVTASITVGSGLGLLAGVLQTFPIALQPTDWLVAGAISVTGLWLLRTQLQTSAVLLPRLYAQAANGWAIALCLVELLLLTGYSYSLYESPQTVSSSGILATGIILGALVYRSWPEVTNLAIYSFGWGLELLTVQVLSLTGRSLVTLAIANIALGLATQLIGDWWQRRSGDRRAISSWHIMPLLYGALGASLRWGVFESWTGLSTLGVTLIAIGVGRRQPEFKPLIYLAIAGISASATEVLFYQVAGLSRGDQLLALAGLAATFTYAYRILSPWLRDYLLLPETELKQVAHLHWFLGTGCLVAALAYPAQVNTLVGLGAGVFLARYAVMQGRHHSDPEIAEVWVYVGLIEAGGLAAYASLLSAPELVRLLVPWQAAIAACGSCVLYGLPWQSWGWPVRPWQRAAILIPGLVALGTAQSVSPLSLLVVATFYSLMAWLRHSIRFTYLSLLLVDWAIVLWLPLLPFSTPLVYPWLLGLSLLYIAQVDPELRQPGQRENRHWLRMIGSGIIGAATFATHYRTGIVPGALGLIAIFLGLSTRIRAILYVGTATFLVTAFYQLVLLIFTYAQLKWMIALLVGLSLISIAASFETRRNQLVALLQNWMIELQNWD